MQQAFRFERLKNSFANQFGQLRKNALFCSLNNGIKR